MNGCITISTAPPFICNADIIQPDCGGQSNGSIALNCVGGTPPYLYFWSDGNTGPVATNLSSGTYFVSIVDANGCSSQNVFTITSGPDLFCVPNVSGSINCNNSEATILMTCSGGTGGFTYQWTTSSGQVIGNAPSTIISASGTYIIAVSDANGCTFLDSITIQGGTQECGSIIGTVTSEDDGNCILNPGETGLSNWMVRATATSGDEYFDFTDSLGNFAMQAPPGGYSVEAIPPPAAYWTDCGGTVSLTLEDARDTDTADFHWLKTISCPLMEVDISTPLLRRCLNNVYYVNYCNNGSETAVGASIEVTLDPLISIISASLPFTGPVNDVYSFGIGDVEPGDCDDFYFLAHVSCDAVLGQTLCAEAHVFPDSLCTPIDPNWSGAYIEITSNCTADSVIFTITNTGTGDMDEPQGFIVVEDGVMLLQSDFELEAGESITVSFAANGSTYNLLAEQVPGVPGFSVLSQFVEGCGTNGTGTFSTGFASQFPEDDNGPFVSIDCHDVIGSYDPNDKRGYPLGYGDEHLIEPGQMLDYHIRFQNTGTDTAFLVVVQDVIDPSLDISTLRPGASSHPYQLDIHQDTLVFIFENILLPDSNVNEPGSHGFVKFSIGQKAGLPLGTVIENEAAIFFDFNDPVLTNTTVHKLGEHFIETAVRKSVLPKKINCTVYPNPFADEAVVLMQGIENQEFELRLFDLTGRFLRSEKIENGVGKIKKNGLAPGLYFYEITTTGIAVGQGKVVLQ
ncbi:MAG: T9SS type A sorting domain-containing protein [Saprospiraceae bacterium]|nr:T9SS type A sorting domain-containing protein [Saprospiraceae bacterium]